MANLTKVTLVSGSPTDSGDVSTMDALLALIGEVQASPTANTLLDRLKALQTAIATTNTDLGTTLHGDLGSVITLLTGTIAVSATALPLPTGAATAANQSTQHTDLVNLLTQTVLAAGTNVIGKVDHTTTGIGDDHKEVTTAGTAVQLGSQAAKWVTIQAYVANTGRIAVGGSTVNASTSIGTGRGVSLAAGESITLPCSNTNLFYIDSTVNSEGVRYTYGS